MKNRERRQAEHLKRQEAALREAGWTPEGGRSLRDAMEARQRGESVLDAPHAGVGLAWLLLAFVAQALLWGNVATGSWFYVALAVLVTAGCAHHWWKVRVESDKRAWAAAGVAVAAVFLLGAVGSVSQIVTEGGVVRVGSKQEQEIEQAALLAKDVERLVWWEELAVISDDEARVRINDLAGAAEAAGNLAGATDEKWATPEISEAARRIRVAASFLHDALLNRHDTALQMDAAKLEMIGPMVAAAAEQRANATRLLEGADGG